VPTLAEEACGMQIRLPHVALVGVLALTVTGVASATIPNSQNGVYTACYGATTGAMRVIDMEAKGNICTASEKLMGWKATGSPGPVGPQGPAGPKGATGPQGPAGPSFARGHFRTSTHNVGTSYQTLATVDMPAGMHAISGKASIYISEILGTEWWAMVSCRLLQKSPAGAETAHDVSHTEVSDDYNERSSLSLMGLAYVPAGQTDKLHLQCTDDGGIGGELTTLNNVKVIAQQVGGYTALAN
jgi:hypothetical protein